MKPLQIALVLVVGMVAGALTIKIAQHRRTPAQPQAVAAQVQPPAQPQIVTPQPVTPQAVTPQAQPPEPPPAAPPVVESHRRPSPFAPVKPRRAVHVAAARPAPVAAVETVPPAAAPPVATPPVSTPVEAPPAPEIPPARVDPEHETPPPPPAPPEPHKVTLNAGTLISVRLVDGLSAERNSPGDSFAATLDKELVADGFVIAERGARVEGRVVFSDRGGRVTGVSTLSVELTRLHTSDGQTVDIRTAPFERRAQQSRGEDAAKIGAGAALGAVIGGIAGGGKGAAIGAGAGGGIGAGTVMATRGKPAALPSETRVPFQLSAPVTLTERLR